MSGVKGECVVCKEPATLRCSACHSVFYCKREHQSDDWRKHKKVCRGYEVNISGDGPYVVATRNFKEDEVIVKETPFVVGPNYLVDKEEVCPGCHRRESKLMFRCPRCDWPICHPECPGLADALRHGAECAVLSKIKSGKFPRRSFVILPLRCLLLQINDPKKWNLFLRMAIRPFMVSTSSASTESMLVLQKFILEPLAKAAPGMLRDCSEETVKKVFAVLNVYGLDIHAPHFGHLVAVCTASSMEHSCVPNACLFVDMPPIAAGISTSAELRCRVIMRATRDIRKGENITTLFMDSWSSTWARQVSLYSRRKFYCKCARCLDPHELGTDFGTLKCTKGEGCPGWVVPVNTLNIVLSDWKCETCGKLYPDPEVRTLLLKIKDEMNGYRMGSDQSVGRYETLLKRLLTLFHPNHHYCMIVKNRLASFYGCPLTEASGQGRQMTDAELIRTAELCQDVLRMMCNPVIVIKNLDEVSSLQILLALTNTAIAKRKRASGAWDEARVTKVLADSQKMMHCASRLKHSQFDMSTAHEHLPIELMERMMGSIFLSFQAGLM